MRSCSTPAFSLRQLRGWELAGWNGSRQDPIRGPGPRVVAIVLTFLDTTTGVPERLFCRVDVTEEWPFVAGEGASQSPIGLTPFVDNELFGMAF